MFSSKPALRLIVTLKTEQPSSACPTALRIIRSICP